MFSLIDLQENLEILSVEGEIKIKKPGSVK